MYDSKALSQIGTVTLALISMLMFTACADAHLKAAPPFINEKVVSLKIADYCPKDGYNFSEIFVFNSSTVSAGDHHLPDFDRDGLSDPFESDVTTKTTFNISAAEADTNADGYSDLVVNLIGYDKTNQVRLRACINPDDDTDQDGLSDCEEKTLRTDPLKPDSDGDGIPDGLEVRFGTNPNDMVDSRSDLDQDGAVALEEIKVNTPIHLSNGLRVTEKAYRYKVTTTVGASGQNCYNITVGNIPVLRLNNGNLIRVMAMERKSLVGQGDVSRIRSLKVLVPELLVENMSRVVVTDIIDQVVDGISTPLTIEDGRGD